MSSDFLADAASALFHAEKNRAQIGLLSKDCPRADMDAAYAIQERLVRLKLADGLSQIGWKIGLTSKAMQSALHIDVPDSGVLFDNMLFASGGTVPEGRFIQPRVEAEIAFVMERDVSGDDVCYQDIVAATAYVVPSLEILDTRVIRQDPATGARRNVFDTIADNAANAGVVLGEQRSAIAEHDLRWVGAIVSKNDEVEETGLGAGVLNDPVTSVLWLARRISQYGQSIRAGDIVLSGSFIRPIEATAGSRFHADFGDFGLVEINFA